jgi:hypothetical protein
METTSFTNPYIKGNYHMIFSRLMGEPLSKLELVRYGASLGMTPQNALYAVNIILSPRENSCGRNNQGDPRGHSSARGDRYFVKVLPPSPDPSRGNLPRFEVHARVTPLEQKKRLKPRILRQLDLELESKSAAQWREEGT